MLKIFVERWEENKQALKEILPTIRNLNKWKYRHLVRFTFDVIYNTVDDRVYRLDTSRLTEIDDGEEKGTLIYVIPFETPTPTERDYLMTFIGYGSCPSCDVLEKAQEEEDKENQLKMYMSICKDIITNTIKPYNYGWRNEELFDEVIIEGETTEPKKKGDGDVVPISSPKEELNRAQK